MVVAMVKLSILYGHPQDPTAFEDYYANVHMPLGAKIPDAVRAETSKVAGTPDGQQPKWYRTTDIYFDSMEELRAALASAEGEAALSDISRFATGGAETFICEVDGS